METNNKTIVLSLSGAETDLNQRVVIETEAKDPERISSSVSISISISISISTINSQNICLRIL